MQSAHLIYGYMAYGKGPLKQWQRKPAASWAIFSDLQEKFYMHHPTDRIVHTMAFVTSTVEY